MSSPAEITSLLAAARGGDSKAHEDLVDRIYQDLHCIAQRQMRKERPDHTLQPTGLVNEAYFRLNFSNLHDRTHLLATAATVMRRFLIDYAKKRGAQKNGGGKRVGLDEFLVSTDPTDDPTLVIDQALTRLAGFDPRKARIVELIYFGGLNRDEVAAELGISPRTVRREWVFARAWLHAELDRPLE